MRHHRVTTTTALAAALLLVGAGPALAGDAGTTAQTSAHAGDGTVSTSVVAGSRLFVGGSFTTVNGASHKGIAALDAATGALDPSFAVSVNGTVTSLASDGTDVFVGGTFSSVTGPAGSVSRKNVAEFGPDGSVLPFNPMPSAGVTTMDYSGGVLYLGGKFSTVGGTARTFLAGVTVATGALTPFNPQPDGAVSKVVAAADGTVYVGGLFGTIGSVTRNYVADIDPSTNTVQSYNAELPFQPTPADRAEVIDLVVSNGSVYLGTGGHLPYGNSIYKTTAGVDAPPVWQVQTDGNVQAVDVVPGSTKIYAGGHFDNLCLPSTTGTSCPTANLSPAKKTFTVEDSTGVTQPWVTFNSPLGVWDLTNAGGNLYALGVFTKPVARIARFQIQPDAQTVPSAPVGVQGVAGDGSASLTWSPPASDGGAPVTGYTVYRDSGAGPVVVGTPTGTSFTDSGLTNGTTYSYTVSATNSLGQGPVSAPPVAVTPVAASSVPGAPGGFTVTAGSGGNTLSWSAPDQGSSPITGYDVYRGTTSGGETLYASGVTSTSYLDSAATAGTAYFYQVSAVNAVGEGGRSVEQSTGTPPPPTVPAAPTLTGTANPGPIVLSWTESNDGGSPVTSYAVLRNGAFLKSVGGSMSTYTDKSARAGKTYTYQVRAQNSVGKSANSNPVQLTAQ